MAKKGKIILISAVVIIGGGLLALLVMDIPAPSERIERTLPDDQFPD